MINHKCLSVLLMIFALLGSRGFSDTKIHTSPEMESDSLANLPKRAPQEAEGLSLFEKNARRCFNYFQNKEARRWKHGDKSDVTAKLDAFWERIALESCIAKALSGFGKSLGLPGELNCKRPALDDVKR